MAETNNVFISWSGERSKLAAEALYEWLPIVLQTAKPWMSSEDIQKGSRGLRDIGTALDGMKVGIICLTPENLAAQWILFEAGALSKTVDANTRVCTYLLCGLQTRNVKPPLGMFQATEANKEDTRRLVHTINKSLDGFAAVLDGRLDAAFDALWPRLAAELSALPEAVETVEATRSVDEMVGEILALGRAAANSRKGVECLDPFLPIFEQLLPYVPVVSEAIKKLPRPENLLIPTVRDQGG